jgi:hypothetical protein
VATNREELNALLFADYLHFHSVQRWRAAAGSVPLSISPIRSGLGLGYGACGTIRRPV